MTSPLVLTLQDDRRAFAPGDTIAGSLRWQIDDKPRRVRVSLGWRTEGRGSTDEATLGEVELHVDESAGEAPFAFRIPEEAPYSYDGPLVSIEYAVQAQVSMWLTRGPKTAIAVIISPTLEPIRPTGREAGSTLP